MKSQQADERDVVPAVNRLIAQLGVGGLVALIAEITEQQSDYFLLSGEQPEGGAMHARFSNIATRGANARAPRPRVGLKAG